MLHEMTLFPRPYAEKRKSIHFGDQILFTNTEDTNDTLRSGWVACF